MKTLLLIILSLLVATSMFAFVKGTLNPGGTVSFSSIKYNSKADPIIYFSLAPQLGYFVIDNLAADAMLNLELESQSKDKRSVTGLGFGLGGRYFYNNFYGGLGFLYESYTVKWESDYTGSTEKDKSSAMFLVPKIGYVLPMARNVYVDLGMNYTMGIGKVGDEDPDLEYDNEYSRIQFLVGLQIFYPSTLK